MLRRYLPSFTLALGVFLLPTVGIAQFGATPLSIASSVNAPSPGAAVTLTLSGPTLDLDTASIVWRRDGATILEGVGEKSVEVTLGALGVETTISASVSTEAESTSAEISFTPSRVELLWEADSYAPPTYAGRALPSAGARVRLWALPYLPRPGGGYFAANDLTYTWKLNGGTLANISGRGRSSATIGAPELFGAYTVSVEVSAAGGARGVGSTRIAAVEPVVRLYPDHPLFGLERWSALSGNAFIAEREMTFSVIPYFAPVRSPDDAQLLYAWRIDRARIPTDTAHPSMITVSAPQDGMLATIDLALTHASNFLIEAHGAWQVTLGAGASTGLFDPFRTTQ